MPQTFFNRVDREYAAGRVDQGVDNRISQEEKANIQNVHNYAIFEAFNEALDSERPYKSKGTPMPWSKNTRVVGQHVTEAQAKLMIERATEKVKLWAEFGAGSKYAPLPPTPTQTQDEFGEEIVQPPLGDGEEDRRNQQRQEKLGQLMTEDIKETDVLWTDYEVEDTQVRLDLADMILADLASEIVGLLK